MQTHDRTLPTTFRKRFIHRNLRDSDSEGDFVVNNGSAIWAIEVKSGRGGKPSSIEAFKKVYPKAKIWIIRTGGSPLHEFFSQPAVDWFK